MEPGPKTKMQRLCRTCQTVLVIKPKEKPRNFATRSTCGISCARRVFSNVLDRLMSFVEKTEGCWVWRGSVDHGGYGLIKVGGRSGKRVLAHRLCFELHYGKPQLNVLHKCDNRRCIRPDHLFEGTIADNVADMISKGRASWQKKAAA